MLTLTRRSALLGLAGAVSLGRTGLALADAPTDRRLVVIILRGAMDGLSAVVPYGDPALAGLRAGLLPANPVGTQGGLFDLGGFYGLHPSLAALHGLYRANQLLPVHAVAGHYRSRSHFEAQDFLESGADHRLSSGWLNRVVAALPATQRTGAAVTLGVDAPLIARGPAIVGAYAPSRIPSPDPALLAGMAAISRPDPLLHAALVDGIAERDFAARAIPISPGPDHRRPFVILADAAGRLLAAPGGPRIAALEIGGWDTHQNQPRQLAEALSELDAGIDALTRALGDAWRRTAVLTMTEFGRTARMNGTRGTDHGTGTVAFVAGGAVLGGRVLADWPGLHDLLDDRDLRPTRDLRALAKGLLASHLGLTPRALDLVFPESQDVTPEGGLIRA